MSERIRNADWKDSSLGPIEFWSETLVTAVNLMLASQDSFSIYWGSEGILLYNDECRALLHEKHPAALGRPGREVWAEAWEIIRPQIEGAYERGETANFTEALIPTFIGGELRDGWYTYSFHPIYENGRVAGVANPGRSVTDLVLSRLSLRRSEQQNEKAFQDLHATLTKLQLAMEFTGQGSFFYDENTSMITVDATVQDLFELQNAAGPAEYWIAKVHPDDQQRVAETFAAAATGEAPYVLEHRIIRSDGVRWIDARAKVLSEPGKPVVFTGVCEDITARKHSEAMLVQTEKLAAVGRLASTIAHEINNPLEAVTNLLYLARHAEDIATAVPFLEAADRELRRASTITNQALRFHKQATRPTASTFAHLVEGIFAGRHARLQNAHATEHLRDRTTHTVLCFENEMRHVLSNLISNAIDGLQPIGGQLHVRARDGHDWKTDRSGMVLTVADTGVGISRATQAKLFDAFFTTKGVGGTGLGLWISNEIVERHDGTMRFRSSQSPNRHGSVFTIFLPYEAVMRGYEEPDA